MLFQYQYQSELYHILRFNKDLLFNFLLIQIFHIKNQMSIFKTANMEYRNLGNTGLKVSVIGFGNMIQYKPQRAQIDDNIIFKCLENGINFFDTAENYANGESQIQLGRALKKSGVQRQDIVISTKIWTNGTNINSKCTTNRKHVLQGMNSSLQRLQLDYVDVVFAHSFDQNTSVQQTCRSFNYLIEEGKAFYWATSNWNAQNIFEAFSVCDRLGLHRPICQQLQYNMLIRKEVQVEFLSLFDKYNFGTTIWSPLAGGYLTGKYLDTIPQGSRLTQDSYFGKDVIQLYYYKPFNNKQTISALRELEKIAKQLGCQLSHLALAWVIKNKDVDVAIIGASVPQQIENNLKALEIYKKLDNDLQIRINKILNSTPTPKMNFAKFIAGNPRRPL